MTLKPIKISTDAARRCAGNLCGYSGIRKRLLAIIRQRIFVQGLGRLQGGIRSFMGLDLTWEIE